MEIELLDTPVMRRLVHISDLHFGRARPELVEKLRSEIQEAQPDLLIVSGDLTQRARPEQFKEAQEFLQSLSVPKLVVPGNHDIPLWNLSLRFLSPLARYQHFISSDLCPSYEDDEISVQGITTAHGKTIAGGKFNPRTLERIIDHWETLPPHILRILVSHHPFESLTSPRRIQKPGFRIKLPEDVELPKHADLILSGHFHDGDAYHTEHVFMTRQRSIVAIEAGTAVSDRQRKEPNSYNRLLLEPGEIHYEKRVWNEELQIYLPEKTKTYFTCIQPSTKMRPLEPMSFV